MSSVIHTHHPYDLADPATLILDLANPRPKDIVAIIEAFDADMKANPVLDPLPVVTGWNEITPEKAIALLRRNRPGANRQVDPATVFYYARQMKAGEWKATGQPALVASDGKMIDFQHRALAVVISGVTIKSYVVTDIEVVPNLFAYIDNSKTRTVATALQTAGYDGVATTIAKVIRLAEEIRLGVFNPSGIAKLPRMTPAEGLAIATRYPNAKTAARAASSDWSDLVSYLGGNSRKDVVACLGMQIIDLHGVEVADDFCEEVTNDEARPSGNPIAALRTVIEKDRKKKTKQMKRHQALANLTLAFNAWIKGQTLTGRWVHNAVTDDFPLVEPPADEQEAA